MRKVLSANSEAHLAIDCLVHETDVHATLKREEFDSISKPLLQACGLGGEFVSGWLAG